MTYTEVLEELKKEYEIDESCPDLCHIMTDIGPTTYDSISICAYDNHDGKIYVSDDADTINAIECDIQVVKEICKEYNVSFDDYCIVTEYKNNDSVRQVIDCIKKIVEINNQNIKVFNKIVEEISKTYQISNKQTQFCLIETDLPKDIASISATIKNGKIIITEAIHGVCSDHSQGTIDSVCKQFNLSYSEGKLFTEYKNNDSLQNIINGVKTLIELHNKDIEFLDKVVNQQISKEYSVSHVATGKYIILTNISNTPIEIIISFSHGNIMLSKPSLKIGVRFKAEEIVKFCEQFNISFNGLAIFTEYKSIDSIAKFIKFIELLAEKFEC